MKVLHVFKFSDDPVITELIIVNDSIIPFRQWLCNHLVGTQVEEGSHGQSWFRDDQGCLHCWFFHNGDHGVIWADTSEGTVGDSRLAELS